MMMPSTQPQINYSFFPSPIKKLYPVIAKESTTENLLHLLQQKNERGFSLLYDNYANALFSIIYQISKNKNTAEDLLQETFIKIWKKIDTYDETKGTLYTWMLRIARNISIDFIRSHRNQFYKQLLNIDLWQNEYFQPSIDIKNDNRLDFIMVKNKASTLHDKYAVVLDLVYFEGYTYEQVAKLLKLPLGTVKTRGRMALTLLKKIC
jgi:RNA polymerase sigma-70 factor, ECF subfamily